MAWNIRNKATRNDASRSRQRRWLYSLALVVTAGLIFVPVLLAVHNTGAFQLDGDASTAIITVPANPGPQGADDWDKVCYEVIFNATSGSNSVKDAAAAAACGGIHSKTSGATGVSWIAEPNLNSTIFTGGGSKDPIDISSWLWKDGAGGLPDKDNLIHAYAARYSLTSSPTCPGPGGEILGATKCDVLFFGSDRYDNSGDAQQGFWFFQNAVGLGTTKSQGGTVFNGVHAAGDVLVISDFSNGGTTSTITVYAWDPTCTAANKPDVTCGDANLRKLVDLANARCDLSSSGDQACGIVNAITTTMPWTFTDKSGTAANGALNGEFYEAGINLSTLGLAGECFAAIAAETRSSTSTTATLKDFVLGGFGHCSTDLTTTPSSTTGGDGTPIPATGISLGLGSVTVYDKAVISVGGSNSWSGSLSFSLCGPAPSNPTGFDPTVGCTTGGTSVAFSTPGNPISGGASAVTFFSDGATITAPGQYCWRAVFTSTTTGVPGDTDASTGECFLVTDTSGVTSAQTWRPQDTGTVTSTGGSSLNGTLSFTLYDSDNCTGAVLYGPENIAVTGTSPQSKTTSNTTANVTQSKTVSWNVVYSGDSNVAGNSHCEKTQLVITN